MTQFDIDQIFETEVLRVTGGDATRIAYQNTQFDPPADGIWYSFSVVPTPVQTPDLAEAAQIFRGIFQVNVVTQAGTGTDNAKRAAKAIAEGLARELVGAGFTVYNGAPTVYTGITDATSYVVPVSVNYRADFIQEA